MIRNGRNVLAWRWSFQPTWGQAAAGTAVIGLGFAIWAGIAALGRRDRLRSWPSVVAHVDSAAVITPQDGRTAVYAERYWLTFRWPGDSRTATSTSSSYSTGYARHWRRIDAARRSGTVSALVNPENPDELDVGAGWNAGYFAIPLILAAVAGFFFGFAALFRWFGRRYGLSEFTGGFISAPTRYGVWIGLILGCGFVVAGGYALYLRLHRRATWRQVDALVDSADVVRESGRSGATYSPRLWLSYRLGDTVFHAPLGQSWSTSNYDAQRRLAAEAAKRGRIVVSVDPNDPLDLTTEPPGSVNLLSVLLWVGFTSICFGLAFLFHRLGRRSTGGE